MVILDFLIENQFSWGFFPTLFSLELDIVIIGLSFLLELSYCFRLDGSPNFITLKEGEQH